MSSPCLLKDPRLLRIAAPLAVGVLFLLAWQLAVDLAHIPAYLLPGPTSIAQALGAHAHTLFLALLMTLKVTFFAFLVATVLGTAAALLFAQSRWLEMSLFPYAVMLQVTPIVAIAPLIIIWIKNTELALVVCAAIIAIFPIISNTTLGLNSVGGNLDNLFTLYRASRWQRLVRLRIPGALPYFFGGLRISSGLALIGAVVAEFVAGTGGQGAGLAYQILQSGYNLQIPEMFAALVLLTVAGVALFGLMVFLSRQALKNWHESAMER
ncbi:putative aliphatic sulfonates transport permease protein SsuC [mine drainage metagenome]|uniref:Putative aliphatic sulfonates transport permease protein SsuC n=1 Tax=mine drainage metagenome TaxID=410659 RepID=A0A1J5Q2T1_9ZZZZ